MPYVVHFLGHRSRAHGQGRSEERRRLAAEKSALSQAAIDQYRRFLVISSSQTEAHVVGSADTTKKKGEQANEGDKEQGKR